jgi:hypothetical protein
MVRAGSKTVCVLLAWPSLLLLLELVEKHREWNELRTRYCCCAAIGLQQFARGRRAENSSKRLHVSQRVVQRMFFEAPNRGARAPARNSNVQAVNNGKCRRISRWSE